jgi:hypothetical protein
MLQQKKLIQHGCLIQKQHDVMKSLNLANKFNKLLK